VGQRSLKQVQLQFNKGGIRYKVHKRGNSSIISVNKELKANNEVNNNLSNMINQIAQPKET
jgi:hypothetical protein